MTRQLAEKTSKCFLPQPFTNDHSPALGGDPSSAKGQQENTNSGAKQRPNFSPAGEAAVNGTLLRRGGPWDGRGGRSRHVRLRDEASLTALTCLLEAPQGRQTLGPLTDVWEDRPIVTQNVFEPHHIRATGS